MTSLRNLAAAAAVGILSPAAFSASFTVAELHLSAKVATDTFKSEYGTEFHDSTYAIQTMRTSDGGKVKIYYRNNNNPVSIEYFCHYHHANEMDCHEL